MRDHFVQRLCEMAAADPRIMLITGDLGFGVLDEYRRRFPEQFLNAGVAEQNMTSLAAGLALEGHVVFTYSIANFVFMRCLEQIRNDAAYHGCNVNVVSIGGGFSYGALGVSHHATEDLAIMRALPETTVLAPGDDYEAIEATQAVAQVEGVCYLRLDKSTAGEQTAPTSPFQVGRARVVREGSNVTLIACGGILGEAIGAAKQLARRGVSARVLSMHTVKPIDHEALAAAARETGGIVTIEEHTVDGGLGSAAAETLLENGCTPGFFRRIGLRGGFASSVGSQEYLRTAYQLDQNAIVNEVVAALKGQSRLAIAA